MGIKNQKIEWTKEMIDDLTLLEMDEHASKYGISASTSRGMRAKLNFPRRVIKKICQTKKYFWPENERDLFKWNTNYQLVELLGIPYSSINKRRKRIGVETDKSISTTEVVLHENIVQQSMMRQDKKRQNLKEKTQIYTLHEQGVTRGEIALRFNKSTPAISKHLRNDATAKEIKRAMQQSSTPNHVTGNLLASSIDKLEVPLKVIYTLKVAEINTLGELIQYTKADLMGVPNLGRRGFADIVIALEKFGLKLRISIVADKQSKKTDSVKAKLNNDLLLP
jgi:hypothetical protein